jgi:outer membrane lipoprotein-sorting protein
MTERNGRYRDDGLGAALAELDVPEHDPAFFAELEDALAVAARQRSRRRLWLPPGVAVAAVAVAVVAAVVLPRIGATETARAAEVAARMSAALAEATSIRGRVVYTTGGVTTRQSFALDARGNLRLTEASGVTDLVFDARRGVERAITTSASLGTGRFYAVRAGLAPGPPDPTRNDFLLARELGAVARALAVAGDTRVREATVEDRNVWLLDVRVVPNTIYADADRLTATVDRETGFPLRVRAMLKGELRSELRLEQLVVGGSLPDDAFLLRFPQGAEILRTDAGFANVSLEDARRVVGYAPLVPAQVPDGFRLATVAVASETEASRAVVSLSYRRGLQQCTVTTRLRGGGTPRDPFTVAGVVVAPEPVRVGGAAAKLVLDPRSVPHVWWAGQRLVVTVAGDLTRAELLAVAESLR